MRNPYLIEGPAQISFSGGRSSAYMLCKIVEAHGGTLPNDIGVAFCNTGAEANATLDFVHRIGEFLHIDIRWLEYRPADHKKDAWTRVDYATASRNHEPFDMVIANSKDGVLPNPVARFCSHRMKSEPMESFMRHTFGLMPTDYLSVVGIRADEPIRIGRMRDRADVDFCLPLVDAGVGRRDIATFWRYMSFDLDLPMTPDGLTPWGNCTGCFLKHPRKLLGIFRERTELADWWIEKELSSGFLFRSDRPNYATLKLMATQPQLFDAEEAEDAQPCECTD